MKNSINKFKDLEHSKLIEELRSLKKNLYILRVKKVVGQLNNSHLFKQYKRNIARIKFLLNKN